MRRLSLKVKLTLLYTLLMMAMVCGILALLFSLSSQEVLTGVQARLEQEVANTVDNIEYEDGSLEFDSDIMDLEYGIYLSVYDAQGVMLYGRIPYDFDNSVTFEDGSIRRFQTETVSYYVMDMYCRVDGYGMLVIRDFHYGSRKQFSDYHPSGGGASSSPGGADGGDGVFYDGQNAPSCKTYHRNGAEDSERW